MSDRQPEAGTILALASQSAHRRSDERPTRVRLPKRSGKIKRAVTRADPSIDRPPEIRVPKMSCVQWHHKMVATRQDPASERPP